MSTLRELKGRIGSVTSNEKITGAMKMISSAKMHRAEADLKRLLPFRQQIETIIGNLLSADAEFSSPLTEAAADVRRVTFVVLGSDDGLCGGYNINIFKGLMAAIADARSAWGDDVEITIVPIGRKLTRASRKLNDPKISVRTLTDANSKTGGEGVRLFTDALCDLFTHGDTDRVDLLYMNFQSVSRQRLRREQYLPVDPSTLTSEGIKAICRPCIFEPDAPTIFRSVLPMYLLAVMQEVFTENRASEQAARIMAMQSANDNAKSLLEQLQLEYNKLRQQSITTELLDILGGQVKN